MRPIDQIQPFVPARRVNRSEGKKQRREAGTGSGKRAERKIPTEHKPDDHEHLVDELA
jgi:hypothetical protein